MIQRDALVELEIEKTAFEGKAVARLDDYVIFVEGAVPGDRVRALIIRRKRQFAEARSVEILRASPHRVSPSCRHFGVCGGCKWQHLDYAQQIFWKREHVVDAFERIGHIANPIVRETLPATEIFHYRNKMEYTFGEKRWLLPEEIGSAVEPAPFALGLHVPGRFDKILHIDECLLQSELSNDILRATREFFLAGNVSPYSTRTHTGDLRHLVIREGKRTGETMAFLIGSDPPAPLVREYAALLHEKFPALTTIVYGKTSRRSLVAQADEEWVLFGPGRIRERMFAFTYDISPASFFQSNTAQAERLYETARNCIGLRPDDVVWDLYCGIGTITLHFAAHCATAVGVDSNPAAVRDAGHNAETNGVGNVTYVCSDILAFLQNRSLPAPDVLIVDPPRSGLHPDVIRGIGERGVERIAYVSCNPATCARDVKLFAEWDYEPGDIQPVDMFPHTYHIECVVPLRKRQGSR